MQPKRTAGPDGIGQPTPHQWIGFLAWPVYRHLGLKFVSRSWFNLEAMCGGLQPLEAKLVEIIGAQRRAEEENNSKCRQHLKKPN